MSMYDDYEDVRAEALRNLQQLVASDQSKSGYASEINGIVLLLARDKILRQSMKRMEEAAREQRFELMDLMESRRKKLRDLIDSGGASTKMLVEDRRREEELKTSMTILEDAQTMIEKEIKEIGEKLLGVRKTSAWLRNEVAKQAQFKAAGRLENFERIY